MKAVRPLILVAMFAGLLALAWWMVHQPRLRLQTEAQIRAAQAALAAQPVCPLAIRAGGSAVRPAAGPDTEGLAPPQLRWQVVRNDGSGRAPEVSVRNVEVAAPDGRQVPACILAVEAVPEPPFAETDWRVGFRLDLSRLPDAPRGRAVFTALVQPDHAATLNGGSIYLYDGSKVRGQSLENLGPSWLPVEVETELAPTAAFVEVWYRLAYQGAISAPVILTVAEPRLDLQAN